MSMKVEKYLMSQEIKLLKKIETFKLMTLELNKKTMNQIMQTCQRKKTRGVRHSQRLTKCTNGDIETEEINEDQTNFVDSCNDGSWSDDGDNCIKEANDSIHSIDGDQQDGYDNASDSENFDENTTSQGMKPLPQQRIEC